MGTRSQKWLSLSDLRKLGFADYLILLLLPEPVVRGNVRYKGEPKIKLWKKIDVDKAMTTLPFLLHQAIQSVNIVNITKEDLRDLYSELVKKEYAPEFFDRWCVNHIRHDPATAYDETRKWLLDKVPDKDEAYVLFKAAVLMKIATVCPDLASDAEDLIRELVRDLPESCGHVVRRIRTRGRAL